MLDKWFDNAVDIQGRPLAIGVQNGRIAVLAASRESTPAVNVVDLGGRLVMPGLVDGHIHLDKSFVGDHWQPHVPATHLRERLAAEKRQLARARPMAERADALIAQAAGFGTVAMRCHVDVDATTGLSHLQAVMEACEPWRDRIDIQLVAFPQAGVMSCPGSVAVLDRAMREGTEVIGGIDPTTLDGDAQGQLDAIFDIAERHGSRIDIHLHEPGMQGTSQLREIAHRTRATGLSGRVTASHAYALGEVAVDEFERTARALAESGVAIMSNAPGDRSFPPLRRLHEAGVTVFAGNDNIRDAWWPYGNGDMLQRAMLIGYRSGFYTDEDLLLALDMATHAAATVIGLEGYGLAVGNEATFLVVDALHGAAAVAGTPAGRRLIHRGVG